MALVVVSTNAFGQEKMTKEEARVHFAEAMVSFKNDVASSYKKGMSAEDFIKAVTEPYNPVNMPSEGSDLLKKAHSYLSKSTPDREIIASYSGKEMALALNFLLTNPTYEESQLFGFRTGNVTSSGKGGPNADFELVGLGFEGGTFTGCKWWQIRCRIKAKISEIKQWIPFMR